MKTLVVIALLAVVTVVYGLNEQRLRKFYDNMNKCREEGLDEIETQVCAVKRDGKLLNANGEFTKELANQGIRESISDESRLKQALKIYNKCHDEADENGLTGYEQTRKICKCAMPILPLLDQL